MPAEWIGYQPSRVALCTCGWVGKAKTLNAVNALAEAHVVEGCEGCDHAIYIESAVLDNKEAY